MELAVTKSKKLFLKKLAKLQKEYGVAICARPKGDFAEVFYKISDKREGKSHLTEDFSNGRGHSSAYENEAFSKYL
jgi:hypothetical protein